MSQPVGDVHAGRSYNELTYLMKMSKNETLRTEASLPFAVTFLVFVLIGICSGFSLKTVSAGDRPGEEASSLFVRDRAPADHALPRSAARNKAVAELRFLCLGKDRKLVSGGSLPFLAADAGALVAPEFARDAKTLVPRPCAIPVAGHHTRVRAPPATLV